MIRAANYAQPLRTIGQDLEVLRVEAFDVENEKDDYILRGRAEVPPQEKSRSHDNKESSFRLLWGRLRGRYPEQNRPSTHPPSFVALELRYTRQDIDRLDREGQARRRDPHRIPDINSLSQLLRAVGAYVNQKGARLLGVSKKDHSVTVQYETLEGRRKKEVLTVSSMYDFCVHMYIHRTDRNR